MTLQQWLKHLWNWISVFPINHKHAHAFIRALGEAEETCLICGRVEIDSNFDAGRDQRILDRCPVVEEEDVT